MKKSFTIKTTQKVHNLRAALRHPKYLLKRVFWEGLASVRLQIEWRKHCFWCMQGIKPLQKHRTIRVRKDFCHSSYWNPKGRQYGYLEENQEFGHLYTCLECDPQGELPEGYEWCEECNTLFNDESLSMSIYEKSGALLCAYCAKDYVQEHLEDFVQKGIPDFDRTLPSVNLDALPLEHPKLRRAPEDAQGWSASMTVPETDRGYGTFREAIKAIVARDNKWLIVVGGAGVTHNICSVAVDVYEYIEA